MAITPEGALLWQPSAARIEKAQLTAYMAWLETTRGLKFAGYHALWQWSVDEVEAFWASIWDFYAITHSAPYTTVLEARTEQSNKRGWLPSIKGQSASLDVIPAADH